MTGTEAGHNAGELPGAPAQVAAPPPVAPPPTPQTNYASREQILGLDDRQFEDVDVPEWSTTVRVRGMTGSERDAWEASLLGPGRPGQAPRVDYSDVRAKLLVRTIVNGAGERVFSDVDVRQLGAKSASALQRIFEVAQRLSRLTDSDVEELTGNSSSGPSAVNGSGSLPTSVSP
jgi:hypothetical protein